MCLVSYIPTSNGFILSSNRDEAPQRSSCEIKREQLPSKEICYPVDSKGGSWIFASDRGEAICLLNGAFLKHKRRSSYRLSRGIMLRSFFEYSSAKEFLRVFDFWGIEPFTMVIAQREQVAEFRWDGSQKHINVLPKNRKSIWSSCTLYPPDIEKERRDLFELKLKGFQTINPDVVKNIHLSTNTLDTPNAFVMNREEKVKTVSFTQITVTHAEWSLDYQVLDSRQTQSIKGKIKANIH